ncbi:MAG TPA: translation initiation factor IF-2 [Anaerolineales bacterium]|nr:translation initiation factor IF-2 [Anaerolineales bacterium]
MSDTSEKVIEIPASITVRDLAERIEASPIDVIKQLMANGVMASINQPIDYDTVAIVIGEFGFEARPMAAPEAEVEDQPAAPGWRQWISDEAPADLVERPPVVTILGHVDHGKTTLLDAIRETNVAGGEAGGITQHIAAYQVRHNNRLITFLDTPGHAAFTAMRARGAQGADIAVLVVAADDGVMPQTREALAHARAARVPIVVALNKVDRPNANPDRVKQQLADEGLKPDDWGGDTLIVPVSAKQRQGIQDLLEAILLTTDATEIRANPTGQVFGTVIEAELDRAKGVVATLLVQNGTLHLGDAVVAGSAHGGLRAMFDFQGKPVQEAGPSTPVSVLGLSDLPQAGEVFRVAASAREAKTTAGAAREAARAADVQRPRVRSLEQVFEAFQAGETQELRLIIKADVQGSLEPIVSSLKELSAGDIRVNILHAATGNITSDDVMLAAASDTIVIGFNVDADSAARRTAEAEGVDIRTYDVIYRLTEDIEKALKGMLEPEKRTVELGRAEVRAVFRIPKTGFIAGCMVLKGEIRRNAQIRVLRAGKVVHEGPISSLKHLKDDVRDVREGYECGIGLRGFDSFEVGDRLDCFAVEVVTAE